MSIVRGDVRTHAACGQLASLPTTCIARRCDHSIKHSAAFSRSFKRYLGTHSTQNKSAKKQRVQPRAHPTGCRSSGTPGAQLLATCRAATRRLASARGHRPPLCHASTSLSTPKQQACTSQWLGCALVHNLIKSKYTPTAVGGARRRRPCTLGLLQACHSGAAAQAAAARPSQSLHPRYLKSTSNKPRFQTKPPSTP